MQMIAIYQLALAKMIADHPKFKETLEGVTVEDAHLEKTEMKFLEQEFGYTPILGRKGPEGNLEKIPEKVTGMVEGDATLVIMINCGLEITLPLIDSYGKMGPKQLILLESAFESATNGTTRPQKECLQRNRRVFGAGHPLPDTEWACRVFQQKGGAQIYYVAEWKKKEKKTN